MNILVVNDDGINAEGLKILVKALSFQGRIFVSAPEHEQSATSHKITITDSIYVKEVEDFIGSSGTVIVSGTPADCVRVGLKFFNTVDFDLVVAGINHGSNLSMDTNYSGTVAAALEARILGVPAIAFSASDIKADFIYDETVKVLDEIISSELYDFDGILNVNYPRTKPVGRKITILGNRYYHFEYIKSKSTPNKYHIVYSFLDSEMNRDTDSYAYDNGIVSITPIQLDTTHLKFVKKLKTHFEEK